MANIAIEVAYATPHKQVLKTLEVPIGTIAREAVAMAHLEQTFPQLNVAEAPLGVFGERLRNPDVYIVRAGERIEVYRKLLRDPKDRRRDKAAGPATSRRMTRG